MVNNATGARSSGRARAKEDRRKKGRPESRCISSHRIYYHYYYIIAIPLDDRHERTCTHRPPTNNNLPVHCVRVFIYVQGVDALIVLAGREHVKLTELPTSSSSSSSSSYRRPPPNPGASVLRGEEEAGGVGDTHRRRRLAIWPPTVCTRVSVYGRRQVLCVCVCVCPYGSEHTRPPVPFSHATRVFDGFSCFFAVLPPLPLPPIPFGNRRTTVSYRKKKKLHFYVFHRPTTVNRTIQFNDYPRLRSPTLFLFLP